MYQRAADGLERHRAGEATGDGRRLRRVADRNGGVDVDAGASLAPRNTARTGLSAPAAAAANGFRHRLFGARPDGREDGDARVHPRVAQHRDQRTVHCLRTCAGEQRDRIADRRAGRQQRQKTLADLACTIGRARLPTTSIRAPLLTSRSTCAALPS